MATPYIVDEKVIKYIDYDLDLRVYPDGDYKILDHNEYNYHKKKMKYPKEIDTIIKKELKELLEIKNQKIGPFNIKTIKMYEKKYKELVKNKKNI